MKTKHDDEKKTEVTATTKARLTIRGQTFEMTMEELKSLHDKIGKVTGQDKPTVIFAPSENDKARQRERPFYPPIPPHWYGPNPRPLDPPYRVTCADRTSLMLELTRSTSGGDGAAMTM